MSISNKAILRVDVENWPRTKPPGKQHLKKQNTSHEALKRHDQKIEIKDFKGKQIFVSNFN